jgi:hypothetical protein
LIKIPAIFLQYRLFNLCGNLILFTLQAKIHQLVCKTRLNNLVEIEYGYGDKLVHQRMWQFIYRLLPCFVASYVDLCRDKKVTADSKEFYGQFVSNLIDSYKDKPEISRGVIESDASISYLQWKFDSVASELQMRLYRDTKPPTVIRQMKEKCFDVLTNFLGRVDQNACGSLYQQWKILLYDFSERMQSSLLQLMKLPLGFSRNEEYALSTLCRMLASSLFEKQDFKDTLEFSDSHLLLSSLFVPYAKAEKLKIFKLQSNVSKFKSYWSAVQSAVDTESKKLGVQQRLGLVLYFCISSKNFATFVSRNSLPKKAILHDSLELLYLQTMSGNLPVAAEKIPVFMSRDLSQVSLQFAKETAPTCYTPVLDRVVNDKVKMSSSEQNTFCPLPHCRWCGLVQISLSEMRVCQFCTYTPKYPDLHLFCSSQCEELAMKHKHGERHAEFLEYGLGLNNVNPKLIVPFVSPNCILFK